jgi:hypothetical protein
MLPGWVAVGIAVVSAWFGGELVEALGVGVYDRAHLDHPPTLGRAKRVPDREPVLGPGGKAPART